MAGSKLAPAREPKRDRDGLIRCRVCGCTEREACNPPCAWTPGTPDLCSNCEATIQVLMTWQEGAHRANRAALLREFDTEQRRVFHARF